MSQSDRAIKKLATQLARLDREVKSWRGAQADYTSIEAGTMDINDSDGNLVSRVGFQDDGSGAVRFFDGPVPPVPSGVTASADGPIIQATWDGTFEGGAEATYDLAYLEVAATQVDDASNVSFATITAKEGASASVVADVTGDWVVAVRSVSQAGKKSEFATAGTVEVKVTDLSGAIEDAQQSANGKNNVTYSESPPTEADEGIVGDTWFVGATDSESGNWNVVAQYQYTVDGWTQVELSHEVIATVDLGKATVGELDGIRIMAKTISGDLFAGDAFDGIVFRGNTFTTRDGNGEFSDRGLFFQKPDGTAIFRVPTDGTPISMSASDVQIERARVDELELNIGRVRSGGLLELSSGVTPPASPPELNAAWARAATLARPESDHNYDWTGLARWGDKWVRAVNVLGDVGDDLDRIEIYNPDGTLDRSFKIENNPRSGVTVLGDTVYTLGPSHTQTYYANYLHGYDLNTGNRVMGSGFTRFYAKNQKKIAIGNDGENLLVAGVAPEAVLYVLRLDRNNGAQIGSDMTTPFDTGKDTDVHGVTIHGGKLLISATWSVRQYSESGGVWVVDPEVAWRNPSQDGAGFVFVDDRPFVVDGSGVVFEGSTRASDYTAEVCFTWYDGTHETTPSPAATINAAARETVTISLPRREGLQKRVYVREGTKWRRNTIPAETTVADIYTGPIVFGPPTTNSFPNADPAVFRSTNGNVVVRGDGSGKWGPLTFNPDGTMSGIPKMAAGTMTLTPTGSSAPYVATMEITFPAGRFTSPPIVVASADSSVVGTTVIAATAYNATSTTCMLRLVRNNTTPTPVNWIAREAG